VVVNTSKVFSLLVALGLALALGACARRTAAPIDDRRPGPVATTPPVATPAPPPVSPPAPAPAQPEGGVQVNPVTGPPAIETRPIGAPPAKPVAPPPARAELKTEPRAFKAPYSDENLAMIQRGEDPRRIKPDAKPPAAGAESKPPAVDAKPPAADAKPPAADGKPSAPEAKAEQQPSSEDKDRVDWSWPAGGRVVDRFEGNSKGVGISGRVGEPVFAAGSGRVVYSGSGLRGYGQLVIIKHNETYLSAYAHNSRILVKEGQTVTKGQKIAEIGSTDADRPKLHFEIRRLGKPVDPLAHLPERR
jgi:lipoprotein NlpD